MALPAGSSSPETSIRFSNLNHRWIGATDATSAVTDLPQPVVARQSIDLTLPGVVTALSSQIVSRPAFCGPRSGESPELGGEKFEERTSRPIGAEHPRRGSDGAALGSCLANHGDEGMPEE